jgi:hypothetical protein
VAQVFGGLQEGVGQRGVELGIAHRQQAPDRVEPGANVTSSGANPTIMSYNASVVNFNNATGSIAHFENKNIFFPFEKRSSLLQRWRCSCKFKNRRIASRVYNYNASVVVRL